jgi:hypothetical protein
MAERQGNHTRAKAARTGHPHSHHRFDWIYSILCGWLIIGLFLDGWAHNHIPQLETFFTPWHAVLYSGYLAVAAFLVLVLLEHHARGHAWERSLPPGYGASLIGAGLFLVGGVLDLLWHELFGIERSVEALLSPTHLLLATGGVLMVSGPLRATWHRKSSAPVLSWRLALPMLLSATYVFSVLTFFTQFAHPLVNIWAASGAYSTGNAEVSVFFNQARGIASILLQTAILMGIVLFLLRRFSLPAGALTLVLGINAVLISFQHDHFALIPVAVLSGVAADALVARLRPSVARVRELRLFAFAVPLINYVLYFLALRLGGGIGWSIHLWLGSAVMAGVVGLLLSYLVAPLPLPTEHTATVPTPATAGNASRAAKGGR